MEDKFREMAERVASLEERAKQSASEQEQLKTAQKEQHTDIQLVRRDIHALLNKVSRWEGRFGGVVFIIGCLWAFLTGLPGAILDWIKTSGAIK